MLTLPKVVKMLDWVEIIEVFLKAINAKISIKKEVIKVKMTLVNEREMVQIFVNSKEEMGDVSEVILLVQEII